MHLAHVQRVLASCCVIASLGGSVSAADTPTPEIGLFGVASQCPCSGEPAPRPPASDGKNVPTAATGSMEQGRTRKDETFNRDRDTFHFLLENHKAIKRTVKKLDNGVETITESDKPEVTRKIQEHVPAMYERLKSGKGVRYWDPLFAEAFKHGKKMKMTIENTKTGVKVVETSEEAEVVKIIQAHADVVSKFVANGFEESRKEHSVPGPEKKK